MYKDDFYNLTNETMFKILENCYNEIYVTDKDMNVIYVNPKCKHHYNLEPEDIIGKNHMELLGKYWYPSALPLTYSEKRSLCIEQLTATGEKIISTTNPVLDENKNVKMVVSVVQEDLKHLDMDINSNSNIEHHLIQRNKNSPIVDIITRSPEVKKLLELCNKSAKSDIPILINGESGTGKTLLAQYIHENSKRSKSPFLSINCAAIPENLLESELFGYAPYAFTGANVKGKVGLIEMANNGTLFLDEIGELSLPLQAKLLNVVENNEFIPVGSTEMKTVNVRIISATNQNLEEMIYDKKFREDLFWRLSIISVKIPALRNRKMDIIPLSQYFLNKYNDKYKVNRTLSRDVIDILQNYSWPGNIRQLKNIINRCFVVSTTKQIKKSDLPEIIVNSISEKSINTNCNMDFHSLVEAKEKEYIQNIFLKYQTSRKLAQEIGISQTKANNLIKKYCITK